LKTLITGICIMNDKEPAHFLTHLPALQGDLTQQGDISKDARKTEVPDK